MTTLKSYLSNYLEKKLALPTYEEFLLNNNIQRLSIGNNHHDIIKAINTDNLLIEVIFDEESYIVNKHDIRLNGSLDELYVDEIYMEEEDEYTSGWDSITAYTNVTTDIKDQLDLYRVLQKYDNLEELLAIESQLSSILEPIYQDNYDLQLAKDYINIILKFPYINITNNRNENRSIYNLYATLQFNIRTQTIHNFCGFRSTLTINDVVNGYNHSHLRAKSYNQLFTSINFCTGSTNLAILLSDLSLKFDETKFELLLYQIQDYVAWESIEGTPYIYLSDKSIRNFSHLLNSNNSFNLEIAYEELINNIDLSNIVLPILDNYNQTVLNLNDVSQSLSHYTPYKGVKSVNSNSVEPLSTLDEERFTHVKQEILSINSYLKPLKSFRNEEIKYEIIQNQEEFNDNSFFTNPRLFEKFINEFKQFYASEIANREEQIISQYRYPDENLVSLL